MSAPDIDTLRNTVREALRCSTLGDWSLNAVATEDLSSLVAIAKEAEDWKDIAPLELRTPGLFRMHVDCLEEAHGEAVERAERAERERDEEKVRREVACTELRTRAERAEREQDDVWAALETIDMQQLINDIVETAESLASPDTEEGA